MNKISILGMIAIVAVASLSLHGSAFAENDNGSDNKKESVKLVQQKENKINNSEDIMRGDASQLRVEPSGEFKASGIIVNTNTAGILGVKLFGINFNINANNARIEGGATTTVVTDIAAGDKISVSGSIDPATGAISAKQILDRTLQVRKTGDIQGRIAELMKIIEQLREQIKQMGR